MHVQSELASLRGELEACQCARQAAELAHQASTQLVASLRGQLESAQAGLEQLASKQSQTSLEAQLQEAHEMLYLKQSQLERLNADKAASMMKLERELATTREELAKSRRPAASALTISHDIMGHRSNGWQAGSGSHPDSGVVPISSALGERYRRLASRPDQVGAVVAAAAALVDRTASTLAFVLRQYPLVRLAALVYILLLHFYFLVLTASMQHAAVVTDKLNSHN
ncbi:uncharacterized protein HaLaN_06338 [Haematococcus lacustris]|uniref:Golgin-84 n=1 Tax=Haematococcus lacustris TaxID=44745 RepID=A0A699Z647_HAELA|nr:uncharacterized protein HaLaN_06338 [Haematococcus lacustris]